MSTFNPETHVLFDHDDRVGTAAMPEKPLKKEVSLEEVIAHVEHNRVMADLSRTICVDGGYRPDENRGAMARPGGDMGYSEALLLLKKAHPELELTPQAAFDLVNQFAKESGRKYGWHSDQHADPEEESEHAHHSTDKPILGCGHCARAVVRPDLYGVDPEDMKELIKIARQHVEDTDLVVLNREHAERAVLMVTGTEKTVNSWDVQGAGDQYFIYDATRDAQTIKKLIAYVKQQGYDINPEEFEAAIQTQTNATLGLLAGNLRIYKVNADGEKPVVTPGDIIPKIA